MKNYFIILILGIVTVGCSGYDIDEILLAREDMSLTMKGKELYAFDPNTGQISFNEERNEYRMFDDDLKNWLIVKWSERPTNEGQIISMDVDWGTKSSFKKEKGLEFEVRNINSEGMIWLWNDSDKIGIVIKDIK